MNATVAAPACTCHQPRLGPHHPRCPVAGQEDVFATPRPTRATLPVLDSPPLTAPGYRRDGPQTSKDAAMVAMGNAKAQRTALYGALRARRSHGANASELDDLMGWPAATSGRRLGEMAKAPVPCIVAVGGVERKTASGNRGQVFVVADCAVPCHCDECREARHFTSTLAERRHRGHRHYA